MDGFSVVELERPGLLSRIVWGRPQANAVREINNLLARKSIHDLTAADVDSVLSGYSFPRSAAQTELRGLYRIALDHRVRYDLHFGDDELAELRQLRAVLGLEDGDAKDIEQSVLRELYRRYLHHALVDERLDDAEKVKLDAMGTNFDLPKTITDAIYKEEVVGVMQRAFSKAVADRRLTHEEETRLAAMSANFGVTIAHGAETESNIARFRLLARIENGDVPTIEPDVLLERSEQCHARFPCTLHEPRTITKAVRYQGPSGSTQIAKGLSWRHGQVSVNRVKTEELRPIDTGTLFITSQRLLFKGAVKNWTLPLDRVGLFTLYGDALRIEERSSRDRVFKGDGDVELVGVILEAVLKGARQAD